MKKIIGIFIVGFALVFSFVNCIKSNYSVEESLEDVTSYEEQQLSMENSIRNISYIINMVMNL